MTREEAIEITCKIKGLGVATITNKNIYDLVHKYGDEGNQEDPPPSHEEFLKALGITQEEALEIYEKDGPEGIVKKLQLPEEAYKSQ